MKDHPDLDINLDRGFSPVELLISLQEQEAKLHSDKDLPFNHTHGDKIKKK